MKVDVLVAEIGSTTTTVSAFDGLASSPVFLGQGLSETTPEDVEVGFRKALKNLEKKLGEEVVAKETYAASSAAGGLRMTVHGLVYDMTVKAAKEAALGAGANIKLVTAGLLSDFDLRKIKTLNPNIIMIAGGLDYGEARTALANCEAVAALKLNIPVLYAGNAAIHEEVREIFKTHGQEGFLFLSENVYPKIDVLNVNPARKIIHSVFEKHITEAPGMEKIRSFISEKIIPTPGAVLKTSLLLHDFLGDLMCVDIGGATTDVFSVAEETEKIGRILTAPEPFAKRTVEGDLGVFANRENLISLLGKEAIQKRLRLTFEELERLLSEYEKIPSPEQIPLTELLAEGALAEAVKRHTGRIINLYGGSGKTQAAEGKDLTGVKNFIATGGALTRLPNGRMIIERFLDKKNPGLLLPKGEVKVLLDRDYVMAALGTFADRYPEAAAKLALKSLEVS